jgi:mTERF
MFSRQLVNCFSMTAVYKVIYHQLPRHLSSSVNTDMVNQLKELVGEERLDHCSNTLQNFGFSKQSSVSILTKCPQLVSVPDIRLENQIQNIRSLGFKDTEVKVMIMKQPETLLQIPTQFRKNFTHLLKELGEQDGRKVAISNPMVLSENFEIVRKKIDYCLIEMGLSKSMLAKAGILDLDLTFLKVRHSLAFRAGYYKRPNKKKPEISELNPSFSDLFRTSDEGFIKKMKGITLEDLIVFEAMIENEDEDEDSEEIEDDREDDEGDEENDQPSRHK